MTTDEKLLRIKLIGFIVVVLIGAVLLACHLLDQPGFLEYIKSIGGSIWQI